MKIWISYGILCILIPAAVLAGVFLFEDRQYAWISLCVTLLASMAFLLTFERSRADTLKLILIGVMTALSVASRILFAPIPGFKPVTALVVLTGLYFGPQAGFVTGAFSALISNFYFSQGPWTPFQMLVWGLIGFLTGLSAKTLKKSRRALLVFGVFAGVLFSLLMDVWTVLWADGYFNLTRYGGAVIAALPVTLEYALSNAIFLLVLARPVGRILERVKIKYGI